MAETKSKPRTGVWTGSIFPECPLPMNFDTYRGCSHRCVYCFADRPGTAKKEHEVEKVIPTGDWKDLQRFVDGKRTAMESWCDWPIPVCIGRMSDPFQPCEKKHGNTLRCLKWLAKRGYPFVFTTKATLMVDDPEYLAVLKDCNCIGQISMLCSEMDKLETGAAKYEDRLRALEKLSAAIPRTIARWQPYFCEYSRSALKEVPRVAATGTYGILMEVALFRRSSRVATQKMNGAYTYPLRMVYQHERAVRAAAHANGLKFLCGDWKQFSDELPCCTGAGLEDRGFLPCKCNVPYWYLKRDEFTITDRMKQAGSGCVFHNLYYNKDDYSKLRKKSFSELMANEIKVRGGYD